MTDKRLGYLGPRGTFSEEAALFYSKSRGRNLQEYPTIAAVIEAVIDNEIEEGLVPLENIIEGGVAATLDHLARQEGIFIRHELIYPVCQCLMASFRISLEQITQVCSHPQALGQCSEYIRLNLPRAECLPVESTAAAARFVVGQHGVVAIAPRRAAELFNLYLLAEGIQDSEENVTRFVVLARQDHIPTGDDKTSLVLTIPDGPGSLYRVLGYFARRNINLTRIESRPSRRIIGDWLFFIDCDGHRTEPDKEELWDEIRGAVTFFKLLGSYPKYSQR
ncbi:MAG TPA: prephenate dehydratase [Candidatus Limnocylindrales bacterium]|nr:prephenate dehydratase [Candidatus Limnocylindrales bacterium]